MGVMSEFSRILNDANNGHIDVKDYKILNDIKFYMYNNPNNPEVIEAKRILANIIYIIYTDPELTKALNMSINHYYERIIKIHENDPFMKHLELLTFFQYTIFIPNPARWEYNIAWFLEDQGFSHVDNIDKLIAAYDDLKHISCPDKYEELDKEIEKYEMICKNVLPYDFNEFVENKKSECAAINEYYDGNPRIDYAKKRIGNIGEIYIFDSIKESFYTKIFVAKDHGNGFGYDIYAKSNNENTPIEYLIEVKATTNKDKSFFELTSTEMGIMKDTIGNEKVQYMVVTVFVDIPNKTYQNKCYQAVNEKTLVDLYGTDTYGFDSINNGKYLFKLVQRTREKNKQ